MEPLNNATYLTVEAGRNELLNSDQENELGRKVRSGCKESRDRMIRSNLRMVIKIANRYKDRGVDYDDVVQFGMMGLIRAVDKFDPDKGTRFSTYAYIWIKETMARGIMDTATEIRIPVNVTKEVNNLKRALHVSMIDDDERVSFEDLHKIMGIQLTAKTVREKMSMVSGFYYDSINVDDHPIEIEFNEDHVENIHNETISAILMDALSTLSNTEKHILCERFGLISGEEKTLQEISDETGLSREGVRQNQLSGMAKMKRKLEFSHSRSAII